MAFIFAACDFFTPTWNEPVGEWFRKYTSEAAIDRHVFSSFYTGTDGLSCVSTESDCTVTFYMRNPQNYDLAPRCSFSGGTGAPSSSIPTSYEPTIVQDASDRSMLRMTLPQQFLRDNDIGKDGAKPVEVNVRIGQDWDDENMRYLREFGSYSFSFVCNSAPPALEGAVVYKEVGGSGNGNGSYVVFFNAPDKALMKELHSDVTHIIINGSRHEVAIEDDGEMTFYGTAFTKVSVSDINNTAKYTPALEKKTFTHISGRDIWCYKTGHTTSGGSHTYTLSLADKLGVAGSATSASTNTAKLAMPSITTKDAVTDSDFVSTGVNLLAYDMWNTGAPLQSTISIIAPTQANGDNVIPVSDVTVRWTLGNNTGTGNVPVPQGVHDLTVWAEKDGFESSDRLHYKVALLKDIYVTENGTGRGTGAEIGNALNIFGDGNDTTIDAVAILEKINAKKAPVDFTIHVSGTIKDTVASIGKQHDSEKMVFANSITIQGTNANKDILSGAAGSDYAVLSLIQSLQDGNGTFTVKNITIQDGSNGGVRLGWTINTISEAINVVMDNVTITNNTSIYGAGVLLQHQANCIMEDCTITKNELKPNDADTHASNGAGVAVGENSTLTLKGTTTISENSTQGNFIGSNHINGIGAYVFSDGTLIMEDDACIQGNTTNYDGLTYGGGVYLTGQSSKLIMRGNATICGNTAGYGGGVYMITLSTVFMADNAVIGDRTALSAATEGSSDANKVSEASAYGGGGGVYIDGGTLYLGYSDFNSEDKPIAAELTGGIVGNYTNNVGGGVYMGTLRASLIMASGNISYNFADKGGGGVHMGGASIIMKGGSITGNKAHGNGGGVFMNGVFTMEGGAITHNTANCTDSAAQEICGGGVYVHGSLIRKNNGIKKEIKGNTLTSEVSNPSLQKKGSQWYEVGNGNCQDDDWESY